MQLNFKKQDHLAEQLSKDYELLRQLEDEHRLASDPQEKAKFKLRIDTLEKEIKSRLFEIENSQIDSAPNATSELEIIQEQTKASYDLRLQRSFPLQNSENIFQTAGALSLEHKTYIDRSCDNKFRQLIREEKLIIVSGEFQIGKTSLLNQISKHLPANRRICYLNVMAKRVDDPHLFITGFFQSLSEHLSTNVSNWEEAAKLAINYSFIILIDEFGALGNKKETAQLFIPQIIDLVVSSNIQVVACLPISVGTIEHFLRSQNITNPRYAKAWRTIIMEPFTEGEIVTLLRLLPEQVFPIALDRLKIIISKTKGYPQPIQCLCRTLFDNYKNGIIGDDLGLLIDQDNSYNE